MMRTNNAMPMAYSSGAYAPSAQFNFTPIQNSLIMPSGASEEKPKKTQDNQVEASANDMFVDIGRISLDSLNQKVDGSRTTQKREQQDWSSSPLLNLTA